MDCKAYWLRRFKKIIVRLRVSTHELCEGFHVLLKLDPSTYPGWVNASLILPTYLVKTHNLSSIFLLHHDNNIMDSIFCSSFENSVLRSISGHICISGKIKKVQLSTFDQSNSWCKIVTRLPGKNSSLSRRLNCSVSIASKLDLSIGQSSKEFVALLELERRSEGRCVKSA